MAATVSQIADWAGLSQPAVSQILNNKGRFSAATRERVLRVAGELGYRPNALARAIRQGRFGCATLLMGNFRRPFYSAGLWNAIHDRLAQESINLEVSRLPDEKLTDESFVPQILQELRADGLIIEYANPIPERMVELITDFNVPSVWMNSRQPSNCVRIDDMAMGRRATEHLLSLGHKRIAYLGSVGPGHYSLLDREQGYRDAMIDAGYLPVTVSRTPDKHDPKRQVEMVKLLLKARPRPTGVVAYSLNEAAALVYQTALQGLRVPEDLSVITFSELPYSQMEVAFSAVLLPMAEMGRAAAEMLLRRIADPKSDQPIERLVGDLIVQETTAPPST